MYDLKRRMRWLGWFLIENTEHNLDDNDEFQS